MKMWIKIVYIFLFILTTFSFFPLLQCIYDYNNFFIFITSLLSFYIINRILTLNKIERKFKNFKNHDIIISSYKNGTEINDEYWNNYLMPTLNNMRENLDKNDIFLKSLEDLRTNILNNSVTTDTKISKKYEKFKDVTSRNKFGLKWYFKNI